MDNNPISPVLLGLLFHIDGKQLRQQYKHHLSDFTSWEQKDHAAEWMLLLARSRYLLFKHPRLWTRDQQQRAELLFSRYPVIQKAYQLSLRLGEIFRLSKTRQEAFKKLALWHVDVESSGLASFKTLDKTIQQHYLGILNFFDNRSTNAAAESFNAKIKAFRTALRVVRC